MLLFAAFIASSAQAKHDWTVHPEQTQSKFVSNLKGWVVGMTVVTNFNTIPPSGIYYPGIKLFTNLVSRGAKLTCYNMWEGPEVGMDAELPFDIKKNAWYYKDEDEPVVKYIPDKRKFSYSFPQKEYSELDYCLIYNDTIYPVNVSAITSKLTYKSTIAENFSEGFDIVDDEMNMGLYSIQTNGWFIADPVDLLTANNIVYKGGETLTNGCKVKVTFNAKSWTMNYKITDPAGRWVVPGSNRELGVKWLKIDGREIKDGMSGENFLFTNDVLVLYNCRGSKIEFKGGLDIMCPYGSTNVFDSLEHSLWGNYGFCNFLGYGRVIFRGPETALKLRDCAMLLNEVESFNADDMPEVIVDNEYYISAPFELLIDGKNARVHKQGKGWKYRHGSLYLDNFQGTNIYCDGYLKVFLESNSQNRVIGGIDSGYGNIRFFGNTNATLTVGAFDHSFGDLSFSNITLTVKNESGSTDFSVFSGNIYAFDSKITVAPAEEHSAMLYVASGSVVLTNSALVVTANDDLAVMTDGSLQIVNSTLSSDGTLEISENAKLFASKVSVGNAGDHSLRVFGNLLSTGSELDLGTLLDVYGTAEFYNGTASVSPDGFGDALSVQGITQATNAVINVTGCAYFMTNVVLRQCGFTISSDCTNTFFCENSLYMTDSVFQAESLADTVVCQNFQACDSAAEIKTASGGPGLVSENVLLQGEKTLVRGCLECANFLMSGGILYSEGNVALSASQSVEFKGGRAKLVGETEALSCPEAVTLSDGTKEDLGGCRLIEIEDGLVRIKE